MKFEGAEVTERDGWQLVAWPRRQLHRQWRRPDGTFRYGVLELPTGTSAPLTEVDAGSQLRFAAIAGDLPSWERSFLAAARLDLDFYLVLDATTAVVTALKERFPDPATAPVLCIVLATGDGDRR
jgi:hypothetical protein